METLEESKAEATEGEKEYNAAWDDLDKAERKEASGEQSPVGEDVRDEKIEEPLPPEPEKSPIHGTVESMEKALNDTKAQLTRVQQENAEYRRLMEAQRAGEATQEQVAAQQKALKDAQDEFESVRQRAEEAYDDYPELKAVIDPLIETAKGLKKRLGEIEERQEVERERDKRQRALDTFNSKIKPRILEVHKDYDDILGINASTGAVDRQKFDEFETWAKEQRPSLKVAALNSNDPDDIIWALTEFKKFKGSPDAKNLAEEGKRRQTQKIIDAQTLRGGNGAFPQRQTEPSKDDYDAGWDDAGKILKKQGVGAQ